MGNSTEIFIQRTKREINIKSDTERYRLRGINLYPIRILGPVYQANNKYLLSTVICQTLFQALGYINEQN